MFITREADYAIRCVLLLAACPERKLTARYIAVQMDLPLGFLAKILQRLSRAGIVRSERGARGGYLLARTNHDLSLFQVIDAIQGPSATNLCAVDPEACTRSAICPVHPVWVQMNREIEQRLAGVSFAELIVRQTEQLAEAVIADAAMRRGNESDSHAAPASASGRIRSQEATNRRWKTATCK
jgi:Rrf2 family transcriptional regulator, iron-sulfur cluster assembly transcription factor